MKVPKLRIMELWSWRNNQAHCNGGEDACIFCYDSTLAKDTGACWITWRSNWPEDLVIYPCVLQAWERVAETNVPASHGQVSVSRDPLPAT